jgi:hypothetical protein
VLSGQNLSETVILVPGRQYPSMKRGIGEDRPVPGGDPCVRY